MDKIARFAEISEEQSVLYANKNSDYGDSFGLSVKEYGLIAAVVRMEDKWNRFKHLAIGQIKPLVKSESIKDTLRDLSNYALMTVLAIEEMEALNNGNEQISDQSCENNSQRTNHGPTPTECGPRVSW